MYLKRDVIQKDVDFMHSRAGVNADVNFKGRFHVFLHTQESQNDFDFFDANILLKVSYRELRITSIQRTMVKERIQSVKMVKSPSQNGDFGYAIQKQLYVFG